MGGAGKFPPPKRKGPAGMKRWSWKEVLEHIEGHKSEEIDEFEKDTGDHKTSCTSGPIHSK
jgi:hypothetical protein